MLIFLSYNTGTIPPPKLKKRASSMIRLSRTTRATVSRYRYPPLFLRPRSPPSTRLPQSPSVRDWSTHSGTKFPHWSDIRLFNPGVEEERCWGSTPLVQTATLRAGSRISSSRDVTGVHETVGWFLRRDEIARSSEHYFFFLPPSFKESNLFR